MIYYFDRYVNGKLMAQGAKITTAKTIDDAIEVAKKLFKDDYCTFKLRNIKGVTNE